MSHGGPNNRRQSDEDEVSELPPPPDGGWGWVVVFGSFMIHIVTDGVTYTFGVFYDQFLEYFNEGKGKTAWILSILVGVTLCSGPISSAFVNRYGCRAVTIAGSILAALCMAVSVWAQNVTTLYVTIGVGTGFGFGLIYLPAIVSVTMYFEKYRSLATGIAVCGSGFGTFVFAPITNYLITEFGWRGAMLIIAAIVLNCIIFGALFRPLEYPTSDASKTQYEAINTSDKFALRATNGTQDLHVSAQNLPALIITNGEHSMQRPHSIGHFSLPKTMTYKNTLVEMNGNIPKEKKYSEISRLALSQPMLLTSTQSEGRSYGRTYGSQQMRRPGPIDKPDVFYQGSLMNIPQYRSKADLKAAEEADLVDGRHSSFSHKRRNENNPQRYKFCGIFTCSEETKDTLDEMLDLSLFKDAIFILFVMSNFCTSIGFNVPYVYIVSRAKELHISQDRASMLLSTIGIANTVGRIILGYLSDKPWINRLWVYNVCLTICGLATIFSAFCWDFYTMAVYASVFGFTIGAYVGLTSVILVDLLGLEKLTNAFGLLLLFQGIASLIGPPIAGWLYDALQSYDPGFYVAGVTIAISGLMLFAIPPLQRWQVAKQRRVAVTREEL